MKIKVGLTFEEFIDVMYLLDQKHFSRGKKHLKLCTGERLKYVGDGVIEVMGYSAVSNFGDYLSDYLTGKNYKPFINYLVVYGKLRNKLRNPAKFNRYSLYTGIKPRYYLTGLKSPCYLCPAGD